MRSRTRELLYNRLHRGFVLTSVGVTLLGSVFLGIQVYNYLRYVRPLRKQLQIERERELLNEGMDTADLNS